MKIVLIGPLKPLRGGIAHSNEALFQNLSKNNSVFPISFKRLFPKFLYPGKFAKEQNDISQGQILDSVNPFNWLTTARKINSLNPEKIIFQWWSTFLFPCYLTLSLLCKGKKIAICQNIFPHHEGQFKLLKNIFHESLTKILLSRMDRLVAMSNSDRQKLFRLFPNKETGLYLEPIYSLATNSKKMPKSVAKKKLNLEQKNVLLFFGFIREYKGLKYLIQAMPMVKEKCKAHLLIVGEFWEDKGEYLRMIKELGLEDSITIIDKYVPDSEVPIYFSASDIIVLPYLDISESGIIRVAFGFDLPILATNVGGNPDHIQDSYNGFLVEPKNPGQIAEKLIEFFSKKLYSKMSKAMRSKRKELEWSEEKAKNVLG